MFEFEELRQITIAILRFPEVLIKLDFRLAFFARVVVVRDEVGAVAGKGRV